MSDIEVKPAGSMQITFEHTLDRIKYWNDILRLAQLNHFAELSEFMEIKATGCIEEWEYISHVMCPHHEMTIVASHNGYKQRKCRTCGMVAWDRPQ